MASFCLAGNVESSSFTHAERLCDILKQTLPACDIQKYVCLSKQWKLAQAQVCNEKGFDLNEVQKLQCAVWHEDGRFIGGADAFAQYCKSTYSVKSDLELNELPGIAKENVKVVEQMFAESTEGTVLLAVGSTSTSY